MNTNKEFEKEWQKLIKGNKWDTENLQNIVITSCLGTIISILLSWLGFHIFVNEFVRELSWQKTLLIWHSFVFIVSKLK